MSVFGFPPIIQIRVSHHLVIVLSFVCMWLSLQSHIIFHSNHSPSEIGILMLLLFIDSVYNHTSDSNGSDPSLWVCVLV